MCICWTYHQKKKPTVNIHRKRLFSLISYVNSAGHSGSMKDKNETDHYHHAQNYLKTE